MVEIGGREPPKLLYHYTSAHGLLGILKSQSLWATSLRSVNDSSELLYAFEVFRELEAKWSKEGKPVRTHVHESSMHYDPDKQEAVTVCSFSVSEHADQLSQWRGYCPAEGGYAIALWSDQLKKLVSKADSNATWHFGPCRYTRADQEALFKPLLDKHAGLFEDSAGHVSAMDDFLALASFVKHESFKEEAEWRLVSGKMPVSYLQVRASGATMIPYAVLEPTQECDGGMLPIMRVKIGPQANPKESEAGITAALRQYHRKEEITFSEIPYRPLEESGTFGRLVLMHVDGTPMRRKRRRRAATVLAAPQDVTIGCSAPSKKRQEKDRMGRQGSSVAPTASYRRYRARRPVICITTTGLGRG